MRRILEMKLSGVIKSGLLEIKYFLETIIIYIFIRKSGLIPRSSAAAVTNQNHGRSGIKPDILINFLTERASVLLQHNVKDTAELCSAEAHCTFVMIW